MNKVLREHALSIFEAGVKAVTPQRLFTDKLKIESNLLAIDDQVIIDLSKYCASLWSVLGKPLQAWPKSSIVNSSAAFRIPFSGWINAPAGSFRDGDAGPHIHLHAARPAGVNEPTEAAIFGTRQILKLVQGCTPRDLVLVLLSGGGSALLVALPAGVTLQDKQAVAQLIAGAGGNIEQLNIMAPLSEVKGGGLARACRAGRMVSLIISDVLDDSLQTIASGPTLITANRDANQALVALKQLNLFDEPRLQNICSFLRRNAAYNTSNFDKRSIPAVEHVILANNATAVDAAGTRAVELGYRYLMQSARSSEGDVGALAKHLSGAIEQLLGQREVDCLISGGEPTVLLPEPSQRQALVAATSNWLSQLWSR